MLETSKFAKVSHHQTFPLIIYRITNFENNKIKKPSKLRFAATIYICSRLFSKEGII